MNSYVPRILTGLPNLNESKRIKIRYRKLTNDLYSIYFDLIIHNTRQREFLKIYLRGTNNSYKEDKQKLNYVVSLRDFRETELMQKQHGFELINTKREIVFIEYLSSLAEKKNKNWFSMLQQFKHFLKQKKLNDNLTFSEIEPKLCQEFADFMLSNLKDITAKSYFDKFKACFAHAIRSGIIESNPANGIHIKAKVVKKEYLTIEEIQILINTYSQNQHVKNAFIFSCFSGLRLSDINSIKFTDIQDGEIKIRQRKTQNLVTIPLHKIVYFVIEQQKLITKSDYIFNLPSKTWISVILRKWFQAAKISKNITFHNSRHTFATLCISNDIDLYTTSKLLGHSSVKTTEQVYANITDKKKRDAIKKIPELNL
jgi:integrase